MKTFIAYACLIALVLLFTPFSACNGSSAKVPEIEVEESGQEENLDAPLPSGERTG